MSTCFLHPNAFFSVPSTLNPSKFSKGSHVSLIQFLIFKAVFTLSASYCMPM
uniref:Uncharacterized protein n=1 Tax=Anguilla anguilla TaxID=7936 RepID=A0A0E9UB85_ANGAN